nr:uncharacterized protein LOC109149321 [Ipomoea trifida]
MASSAALITVHPSPPMALFKSGFHHLHGPVLIHMRKNSVPAICSVKLPTMGQFDEPSKFKMQLCYAKQKLWDLFPDSLKKFQWEKAESVAVQQLLVFGKEVLKWLLTALFIGGSVFDTIYSISINKELLVPCGLFAGCIMADFLKEVSQELLSNSKVEEGLTLQLLGIGSFFALLKSISIFFTPGVKVFLLHLVNGGLMQILWNLRILTRKEKGIKENSLLEEASVQGQEN